MVPGDPRQVASLGLCRNYSPVDFQEMRRSQRVLEHLRNLSDCRAVFPKRNQTGFATRTSPGALLSSSCRCQKLAPAVSRFCCVGSRETRPVYEAEFGTSSAPSNWRFTASSGQGTTRLGPDGSMPWDWVVAVVGELAASARDR